MRSVPWQCRQCRICIIMLSLGWLEGCSKSYTPREHSRPTPLKHPLGWNAQAQMHMVGQSMPLDQFDTHLLTEFPQDLADVLTERTKDCFLPIFRYDDDVVSAIPPDMALILPFAHCGFSFVWPWRVP